MKNIIVRMRGGLGNQLFIYAYARAIQERNKNAKILLDLRGYKKFKLRSFDLSFFSLNSYVGNFKTSDISNLGNIIYTCTRKLYQVLFYINREVFKKNNKLLNLPFFKFGFLYNGNDYMGLSTIPDKKNVYVFGYYQDKKYVDTVRSEIVKELRLKPKLSKKANEFKNQINSSTNSIAVSIRCGDDYKKLGWPLCSIKYYKKGIEYIQNKIPNADIYIYSDEIETVKKSFGFTDNVTYIEGCSGYESLYLMSLSNHFVIANSSFSWWGAYLSQNKNKIVVAPTFWYRNKKTKDTGLYSGQMVLIDN
ncbi:alpha-1,2-fucosyltransferase [Ornithinibacillus halophilus]|uniref:Glycosyl transferase family 11 n=1 Tax=Ornithinibacillus halophilus TaxID=930117 RepID=A0A1M5GI34_9BACI|nr:alpha-1,2-fucosyltransferase [Ornithinibacillus halophilus]SHG03377.1 Glycosyl transferase family 11 [Ornithinibacillus halophilus]